MNCCWILLLLLCRGRGCSGTAARMSDCGCGSERQRNDGGRETCDSRNDRRNDRDDRRSDRNDRRSDRNDRDDGCREEAPCGRDVADTIPPTWQEYAKRDDDGC